MADFNFLDKGKIDYKICWDYQEDLLSFIVKQKKDKGIPVSENYFLLLEHLPVYTLGKSGKSENLLIREEFLRKIGAVLYRIDRGGDITFHGPGQLVGYPILDLEYYHLGIREYVYKMEEAILLTIAEFGIKGGRKQGATGVWLDPSSPVEARKICAIGVRVSRFVTMHGFALNINTDLKYFEYINPCGFTSFSVTSLQKELGYPVDMDQVKEILKQKFNAIF